MYVFMFSARVLRSGCRTRSWVKREDLRICCQRLAGVQGIPPRKSVPTTVLSVGTVVALRPSTMIASPTGIDCGSCFATVTARSQNLVLQALRFAKSCAHHVLSEGALVEEIQARVDVLDQKLADLGAGRFGQEGGAFVGFRDYRGLVEDDAPAILVRRSAQRKGEAQEQREQCEGRRLERVDLRSHRVVGACFQSAPDAVADLGGGQ